LSNYHTKNEITNILNNNYYTKDEITNLKSDISIE
jgi:hypothetical protein